MGPEEDFLGVETHTVGWSWLFTEEGDLSLSPLHGTWPLEPVSSLVSVLFDLDHL